ncbi:UNVERIFIED_CONTAM: hypothetical protein FKN15_058840 [Acipenser sinensis]
MGEPMHPMPGWGSPQFQNLDLQQEESRKNTCCLCLRLLHRFHHQEQSSGSCLCLHQLHRQEQSSRSCLCLRHLHQQRVNACWFRLSRRGRTACPSHRIPGIHPLLVPSPPPPAEGEYLRLPLPPEGPLLLLLLPSPPEGQLQLLLLPSPPKGPLLLLLSPPEGPASPGVATSPAMRQEILWLEPHEEELPAMKKGGEHYMGTSTTSQGAQFCARRIVV